MVAVVFEGPAWAHRVGEDEYGIYAKIQFAKVMQTFRWIGPGSFMMGSPKDEHKRRKYEDQHPVTLTKGFWLGDTTVTQVFWEAVMKDNPSHFKISPEHPVETVSWEYIQPFLKKLNQQISGLKAKLPTEAQWEYACRAGTKTAFYVGEQIDAAQANYDASVPYRNEKAGAYREHTLPVKSLPANAWGLYEMHGNVWEWCEDAWESYLGYMEVSDPVGKVSGSNKGLFGRQAAVCRVLRGGSWNSLGWYVRSASRLRNASVNCGRYTGFRLALGNTAPKFG